MRYSVHNTILNVKCKMVKFGNSNFKSKSLLVAVPFLILIKTYDKPQRQEVYNMFFYVNERITGIEYFGMEKVRKLIDQPPF